MKEIFRKVMRKLVHVDLLNIYKLPPNASSHLRDVNTCYKLNNDCIYLYKSSDTVHYAHYVLGGCYISEIDKTIIIPDSYYIYNCVTKEEFRGKGYYKKALSILIDNLASSNEVYICALNSNSASIATIEKVGFQFVGRVTFIKFLFIKLVLRKEIDDEKISFL